MHGVVDNGLVGRFKPDFDVVAWRQHTDAAVALSTRPAGGLFAMFGTTGQEDID